MRISLANTLCAAGATLSVLAAGAVLSCGGAQPAAETASPAAEPAPVAKPAPGHEHDAPAVHGMLIFGTSSIFVSHLPLFHAPHDYQVIAEVELVTKPAQLESGFLARDTPHGYHTLAPEPFAIQGLAQPGFEFEGTLVAGHFERPGHVEIGPVVVRVVRSVRFTRLDAAASAREHYQGVIFGNGETGEYYVAHRIHGAPSFDQISLIGGGGPGPSASWGGGLEIVARAHPDTPLPRDGELELQVDGRVTAVKTRALYTEVGELQR